MSSYDKISIHFLNSLDYQDTEMHPRFRKYAHVSRTHEQYDFVCMN